MGELLERVLAATGQLPDDTLGRVICTVLGVPFGSAEVCCGDDGSDELSVYPRGPMAFTDDVWRSYRNRAPDVSVDAVLALVERVRPDWAWSVGNTMGGGQAYLMRRGAALVGATAATPALALLAALLRTLEPTP